LSRKLFIFLLLGTIFFVVIIITAGEVEARQIQPEILRSQKSAGVSNEYCLSCHSDTDKRVTFPSGEEMPLNVDSNEYDNSIHGKGGYACVQCHTNIVSYPHPEVTSQTRRDFTLELNQTCANCHNWAYDPTKTGVHQLAQAHGNKEAAVCTDCHTAHNVQPLDQPRTKITQTCERCHSTIYQEYTQSVHGSALVGEGNPDVPDCTSCHGSHFIQGPSTGDFRLYSPQICEKCHSDKTLMEKYGISTYIEETYVSDFHGRTIELFEPQYPGQQTNKPVCIDCHGVHNVKGPNDQDSTVMKDNLLKTCQKCHPDANNNFPLAWMGHYPPSPTNFPLVYFVDLFYKFFIPGVLGFMVFFVLADLIRRIINHRSSKKLKGITNA
jgi:predicted CXXCH cytochrome family protein